MSKRNTAHNEYLTVSEVGEHLNISLSKAYQLAHRKDFPSCRFGGTIRVPRTAFLQWVQMHTYMPKALSFEVA